MNVQVMSCGDIEVGEDLFLLGELDEQILMICKKAGFLNMRLRGCGVVRFIISRLSPNLMFDKLQV